MFFANAPKDGSTPKNTAETKPEEQLVTEPCMLLSQAEDTVDATTNAETTPEFPPTEDIEPPKEEPAKEEEPMEVDAAVAPAAGKKRSADDAAVADGTKVRIGRRMLHIRVVCHSHLFA